MYFQKEVDAFNKEYGSWEQLKRFELLNEELSIEANELTPTLKLKRKNIMKNHEANVKIIYN